LSRKRIAVVAPGARVPPETAGAVAALAERLRPELEIVFHPQCFLSHGHFAGEDRQRADAFVEAANDPAFDAVWFGRGGYGSCRMVEAALPRLNGAARAKAYLGYSDMGALMAGLYRSASRGWRTVRCARTSCARVARRRSGGRWPGWPRRRPRRWSRRWTAAPRRRPSTCRS
jgi:muramoyltetrapeptide carboxypeptidase LdcA involved in peptidoglycan recycling